MILGSSSIVSDESFERQPVSEPVLLAVLNEAASVLRAEELPFACIGGIASAARGRARWTSDIDFFVRPEDVKRALGALGDAGFRTQETNEHWIHKAHKDGVLVDLIFRSEGDITLDEEMMARTTECEFRGMKIPVIAAEDLLVILARATSEETPHYWHNALGLIANNDLDWDYVVRRARHGARRVLALLVYAESSDLLVPDRAIRTLFDRIYPHEGA